MLISQNSSLILTAGWSGIYEILLIILVFILVFNGLLKNKILNRLNNQMEEEQSKKNFKNKGIKKPSHTDEYVDYEEVN